MILIQWFATTEDLIIYCKVYINKYTFTFLLFVSFFMSFNVLKKEIKEISWILIKLKRKFLLLLVNFSHSFSCFHVLLLFLFLNFHFWFICVKSRKDQILWNIFYCNIIITFLNVSLCILSYVTWNTNAFISQITWNQLGFLIIFLSFSYLPGLVVVIFAMLLLLDVCLSIYII